MTNRQMYNEEVKELFLSAFPEKSQPTYKRAFTASFDYEMGYGKDLFDFTADEINLILEKLHPRTHHASEHNARIITSYIQWAIDRNMTKSKENPIRTMTYDDFEEFVTQKDPYFSEEEVIDIIGGCMNAQDSVIIACLFFEGISGDAGSEIRYMKIQDVDFDNNQVKVINARENRDRTGSWELVKIINKRTLTFTSEITKELIRRAFQQRDYIRRNGFIKDDSYGLETELVMNDYVLRSTKTNTSSFNKPTDRTLVFRRVATIAKTLENVNIKSKNILKSGMIRYGAMLRQQYGKLEKDQYLMICDRFDFNRDRWFSLKDFVNDEMMDRFYGKLATEHITK